MPTCLVFWLTGVHSDTRSTSRRHSSWGLRDNDCDDCSHYVLQFTVFWSEHYSTGVSVCLCVSLCLSLCLYLYLSTWFMCSIPGISDNVSWFSLSVTFAHCKMLILPLVSGCSGLTNTKLCLLPGYLVASSSRIVWFYCCCCLCLAVAVSVVGVPQQQPHRRSGLANLPSVGAIP